MPQPNADLIDTLVSDWKRERPRTRPDAMQVVGRIIRLARRYEDQVTVLLRPHGLAYSDFDVLATLRRSGAPYRLSPTELQRSVLLSSGAMSACLRRLEALELITRQADEADRRRLSAQLTPAGFDLVESLIDARFEAAKRGLSSLTHAQLEALIPLLKVLGADADAASRSL